MKLFGGRKKDDYTIVIGCGRLGANLANALSDDGGNILIMDKNKESFKRLSPGFGGLSIVGDGMDFDSLKEAHIEEASVVIAVTNKDNVNIMVAQIARNIFNVKRVIARLYDPERKCVYNEFGIDSICPAVLSAMEIDKLIFKSEKEGQEEKLLKGPQICDSVQVENSEVEK